MKPERATFRIGVFLLLKNKNKVLLMRRFNTGWKDGWYTFPAGHVDNEESMAHAVVRETLDETNIKVKEKDFVFRI